MDSASIPPPPRRVRRGFVWVAVLTAALAAACAGTGQGSDPYPPAGTPDGERVELFADPGVRAVVLVFTRTDCPISNRYAPEVERLHRRFAPAGVRFYLVYLDPDETSEVIERHRTEFGYTVPALWDPEHRLVEFSGATVTPEASVWVRGAGQVYRGRIDNRYTDYGKARPEASARDLEDVLRIVSEGRTPAFRATRAVGCYIEDLRS